MYTETITPDEQARAQHRLEFARAWMVRKRQEQQEMIDSFHTDPIIIAAFDELKRRNTERGTTIIEL